MASLSSGEETTPWLTVAQALVEFLGAQYSESDGEEQKLSSATSTPESTQQAPKTYEEYKATRRLFL
jgi:predicted kinase